MALTSRAELLIEPKKGRKVWTGIKPGDPTMCIVCGEKRPRITIDFLGEETWERTLGTAWEIHREANGSRTMTCSPSCRRISGRPEGVFDKELPLL